MEAIATRMAFGKRVIELAKTMDFVVCSADTKACGIEKFGEMFPGREFRLGIAEQDLMGTAAGLASCGNKVLVATFAVFATMRACEQVRTFIAHTDLNVTIVGTHTGLQVGGDGATHAAVEDIGIIRSIPNMTIIQPSDAVSAYSLADEAMAFMHPLYVRLHRNHSPLIHDSTFQFNIGQVYELRNYGTDVGIIGSGILLSKSILAADQLEKENIHVKVLEFPTIKPLNKEAVIKLAKETNAILTVEDHNIFNGLGSAVAEVLSENCPTLMKRIGIQDKFSESGDPELLYRDHHMDVESIVEAVKQLLREKAMMR
ncbi:transketolase family protein [Acidaminococcus massiliensis]|uniref:transketolase family protein n=1 Tax=Acidaminococcus massiliensis TaxID=1852375 RepID=UPI0026DDA86C|nr:transketolase C-terminal domain-containing protein [Acidaminococcus massiliensis]